MLRIINPANYEQIPSEKENESCSGLYKLLSKKPTSFNFELREAANLVFNNDFCNGFEIKKQEDLKIFLDCFLSWIFYKKEDAALNNSELLLLAATSILLTKIDESWQLFKETFKIS